MADPVFGMSREGAHRTAETNRRVLGRLPDVGRRTRRVYTGGRGGSGNDVVLFEIIEWLPNANPDLPICDAVIAVVTQVQCGSNYSVGDEVLIVDTCGWLSVPIELLIGSTGRAEAMVTAGFLTTMSCPVLLTIYNVGECVLAITTPLCCTESDAYG